jgi:hypothetical protein
MSLKKRVRCGKCKAVLQVTVRADAEVTLECPRCTAMLRIPALDPKGSSETQQSTPSRQTAKRDPVPDDSDSSDETWDSDLPFDSEDQLAAEDEELFPSQNSTRARSGIVERSLASNSVVKRTTWQNFQQLPSIIRIGTVSGGISGVVLLLLLAWQVLGPAPGDSTIADGTKARVTNAPPESSVPAAANTPIDPRMRRPSGGALSDPIVDLKTRSVRLKQSYDHVIYNETRDELAGLQLNQNEVHIYSAKSLENAEAAPTVFAVPDACRFLVFKPVGKDGVYCASGEGPSVTVFSADGRGALRSIPLKPGTTCGLAASENPDDPWVFVARDESREVRLTAINVTTGEIVDDVGTLGGLPIRISPDGHYITNGWRVMSRAHVQQPPANLPATIFAPGIRQIGPNSPVFFAHNDQFLVRDKNGPLGNQEFLDLESRALCRRESPAPTSSIDSLRCAFRKIPLAIGTWLPELKNGPVPEQPGQVLLATFLTNTFERIPANYRIKFDPELLVAPRQEWPDKVYGNGPRPPNFPPKAASYIRKLNLLPDNRNEQLLCIHGPEVLIIPANQFQHGTDVAVRLPVISKGPHPPGIAVRVPLATDPALKVSLGQPLPEGSRIEGDTFVWTPTHDQSGTHQLTFNYEFGGSKRTLLAPLIVAHPWASMRNAYQRFHYGSHTGGLYGWSIDGASIDRYQPGDTDTTALAPISGQFRTGATILDFAEKSFDKKTYLCVLTKQPSAVQFLDAQSLELEREVPIASTMLLRIRASQNPEDPFLYYTYDSSKGVKTGVIRLNPIEDAGELNGLNELAAVSPDGRIVFQSEAGTYRLISGFSGQLPEFVRCDAAPTSTSKNLLMDRASNLVVVDNFVRSAFSKEKGFPIDGSAIYLQDDHVLTVKSGLNDLSLNRQNYRNPNLPGQTVRLDLPSSVFRIGEEPENVQRLFAKVDAVRNRILVCFENQLIVLPLESVGFEDESAMDAELTPNEPLLANAISQLVLKASGDTDNIRIDKLPEGMTADGMNLTWKPDRSAIGFAYLQVTISRGDRTVNRNVSLQVCGSRQEIEQVLKSPLSSDSVTSKGPLIAANTDEVLSSTERMQDPSQNKPPKTKPSAASNDQNESGALGKIQATISNVDAGTTLVVCDESPQLRLFRNEEIVTGTIGQGTASLSLPNAGPLVVTRMLESKPVYIMVTQAVGVPPELVILDASTLQEVRRMPLPQRGISNITTSAVADDLHVFCSVGRFESDVRSNSGLLAINLLSGKTHEILKNVEECQISADGRLFYVQSDLRSRDKCLAIRTTNFDAEIPACQELTHPTLAEESGPFMVSPFGAVVLSGSNVYDDHLRASVGQVPEHFISPTFMKGRSSIIGVLPKPKTDLNDTTPASIVVGSFDANTMKMSDVDLVIRKFQDGDSLRKLQEIGKNWKVILDEKRGRVICVTDDEFITFDLEELQIPQSGTVGARFLGALTFNAGEQGKIEIELPPDEPQLRITETKLLPGMTLKDNAIQWTPETTNIGQSEISVTVSNGITSRVCPVIFNVVRPRSMPPGDYRFAVVSPLDGSVILVSTDRKQLQQFPVAKAVVDSVAQKTFDLRSPVTALRAKQFGDQYFLIVGSYGNQEIEVIDLQTWGSTGRIPVSDWDGADLQVSQNTSDPFVYYTSGNGILAASLRSMNSSGIVIADAAGGFAICASGTQAFRTTGMGAETGLPRISGGLLANSFNSASPEFSFVFEPVLIPRHHRDQDQRMQIIPDWYGTAAFVDQTLFDAGFETRINIPSQSLASIPIGFLRRGHAAISIQYQKKSDSFPSSSTYQTSVVLVASTVSGHADKYGEVTLADDVSISSTPGTIPTGWRALIDEPHGRIICLGEDRSLVIDIDELKVPQELPLLALLQGPREAAIGRKSLWTVVGMPADGQVKFLKLPEGAVADGNSVSWTPTFKQAGRHFVELELQRGSETKTMKHEIDASWPTVELPFSPVGIAAEYIGPRVALWQRAAINPDLISSNRCGQLLVVNTVNGRTLYSGQLLEKNSIGSIEDGVIAGDRFVFYNRVPEESELWSIPLDGSAPAKQINLPGNRRGAIFSLSVLGNSVIVEFQDRLLFFDTETLEPTRQITPAEGMVPRPVVSQSRFGPSLYGVVMDESLKPTIAQKSPWFSSDLQIAASSNAATQPASPAEPDINADSKRPKLSPGQISVSLILNTESRPNNSSKDKSGEGLPLAARKTSQPWLQQITADIRYSDINGALLTMPLGTMNYRLTDESMGSLYLSRNSDVVLCVGRKLIMLPMPDAKDFLGNDVSHKVAVVPSTPRVIVSSNTETKLGHQIFGDKEKVVAVNGRPALEGLTFDPATLDVTIHGTTLRSELTRLRAKACVNETSETTGPPETRAQIIVENWRSQQQAQAKGVLQYTGPEILEPVPIVILLKDDVGNVVETLSYFVFIELNTSELQTLIAKGLTEPPLSKGKETPMENDGTQELLNSAEEKLKQLLEAQSEATPGK